MLRLSQLGLISVDTVFTTDLAVDATFVRSPHPFSREKGSIWPGVYGHLPLVHAASGFSRGRPFSFTPPGEKVRQDYQVED